MSADSQLALGFSRHSDPQPSRDGAASYGAEKRALRDEIERVMVLRGDGWTADELLAHFPDVHRNSVCSRLNELKRQGRVRKRGDKRQNGYGISVTVWVRAA